MLKIENLSVIFGEKSVLKNLTWSVLPNKIHGLIGLNGSGKTTLLNCIYGFLKFDSGNILLNERALNRSDVSFLETTNFFYSNLTGREFLSIFSSSNQSFHENEWSLLLDLPIDEMIENYSTGMKKKLALLSILKLERQVVILDEPFNGLDIETNHLLEKLIPILKQKGKTIIITSHIMGSLNGICDEIHWINDGVIKKSFEKVEFSDIESLIFENSSVSESLQRLL
ncbi:MAG: ATP-binding cassette domain-containing protein [Arcicella sp.]|jgi:ABC-2 type transport system ATP-binding protein|nr:ATP-binding cassette domain-containing protein [Arcicella sp.]